MLALEGKQSVIFGHRRDEVMGGMEEIA